MSIARFVSNAVANIHSFLYTGNMLKDIVWYKESKGHTYSKYTYQFTFRSWNTWNTGDYSSYLYFY